jgi:hypothetical protein
LKSHTADPRRLAARTAVVNLGRGQQSASLREACPWKFSFYTTE